MIEFPPIQPGEPVEVSATGFVTFHQCPERANARYRGEYGPPSRASFLGGLAHRLFARHLTGGPISPGDLEAVCREEIGSHASLNMKMGELGLKPSTLADVVREAGALYERFRAMPQEGFAGAELELEAFPADGVRLKGVVDAVFDDAGAGLRLVDWKTGEVGADADLQLDFYALVWALQRSEIPGCVEAVSVKTGERHRAVPTRTGLDQTAGQVAEMVNALRSSWDAAREMERRAGPWCRYCPLLDGCSEGRAATAVLG